jgi:hypothetical protein
MCICTDGGLTVVPCKELLFVVVILDRGEIISTFRIPYSVCGN